MLSFFHSSMSFFKSLVPLGSNIIPALALTFPKSGKFSRIKDNLESSSSATIKIDLFYMAICYHIKYQLGETAIKLGYAMKIAFSRPNDFR